MRTSYIIMTMMVVAVFSSCSTTEKFYVSGTPNTKIYTPSYAHIATVGTNGKAKIEIPSDSYYAFFLSKNPDSEFYVPFALDYKRKSRMGTSIVESTGQLIALSGALTAAMGLALKDGGEIIGVGGGMAATGLAMWGFAGSRMEQKSYEYEYEYLTRQQTNEDLRLTKAVFAEPFKGSNNKRVAETVSTSTVKEGTTVSKKRLSDKSTKTLKDYGKQTEGVYVGSGTLSQNGETVESYNGIKVAIERINKNEVNVNVIESDGTEFFEAPSRYKITKNKNGSFTLKHSSISTATISINKNGALVYSHPKINIDGEIYVLKISAK